AGAVDLNGFTSGFGREADVRVAQLDAIGRLAAPSVQVSAYKVDKTDPSLRQHNYVNWPMYQGGTLPFLGDYIFLTPGVQMVPNTPIDAKNTGLPWRWATDPTDTDPTFHAVWTDGRDAVYPADGNFTHYIAPGVGLAACTAPGVNPGSRNANIYTAEIK